MKKSLLHSTEPTMKKLTKLLTGLLLLLVLLLAGCGFFVAQNLKPLANNNAIAITIEKGMYGRKVYDMLEEKGVIRNGDIAYIYARFFIKPELKAGDYLVDNSLPLKELLSYLSNSENAIQDTVTIKLPEGGWLKSFAELIAEKTNLSKDELLALWDDKAYIKELMKDYPFLTDAIFNEDIRYCLEGYLFPDTYEFFTKTSADAVTRKILDNTLKVYNDLKTEFDANQRFSIHEIFTLASIVQYEANKYEDMQKVASVFINRLDIGMMLQSSVTICYAIDLDPGDDWRACERNNDFVSPYNTMMNYGLTPGPIVAPSKNALKAVLNPADTDYLFFIGDVCGDGTVYFAKTYQEHLALIKEYLTCY